MRNIRQQCTYNKVHSATTSIEIMKVMVADDVSGGIRKAKSPSGMANTVEEGLSYLSALADSHHGDQATYGEAYATTSDSESSAEKSTRRHGKREGRW